MSEAAAPDEQIVADYLEANPDFLRRHPELLAQLDIPHQTGGASLIEHQVAVLREQLERLRKRLAAYHDAADSNEALFRRVHEFYLEILAAEDLNALLETTFERLCADFGCERVALGVLHPPAHAALVALGPHREELAELLDAGRSVCGRLGAARLEHFFSAHEIEEIRSAAAVPVGDPPAGLLLLASSDEHKFFPGMGTLFLDLLGRMLGERLARLGSAGEPHPG